MTNWVVRFDSIETVEILRELGILYYVPILYKEVKFVFIKTDMTEEEIVSISGITKASKSGVGTLSN